MKEAMAVLAIMVSTTKMGMRGGKQDCTISKDGGRVREICTTGSAASNIQYFGGTWQSQGQCLHIRVQWGRCAGNWEYERLIIPSRHEVGYPFCRNSNTM